LLSSLAVNLARTLAVPDNCPFGRNATIQCLLCMRLIAVGRVGLLHAVAQVRLVLVRAMEAIATYVSEEVAPHER
jgi:hypothetical protein